VDDTQEQDTNRTIEPPEPKPKNEDDLQQLMNSNPRIKRIDTPVPPHRANHSFNGVMFDIRANEPEDVEIVAFIVLAKGQIKVYTSQNPWKTGNNNNAESDWEVVGETLIKGGQTLTTVKLQKPVLIKSSAQRGFYIHSGSRGDEGLNYQSYPSYSSKIASDVCLTLFPGQARCGVDPFKDHDRDTWSWWRSVRGLSGSVIYRSIKKKWCPKNHHEFPPGFRRTVVVLFMLQDRPDCVFHKLPMEALFYIVEAMEWDWFGTFARIEEPAMKSTGYFYNDSDDYDYF